MCANSRQNMPPAPYISISLVRAVMTKSLTIHETLVQTQKACLLAFSPVLTAHKQSSRSPTMQSRRPRILHFQFTVRFSRAISPSKGWSQKDIPVPHPTNLPALAFLSVSFRLLIITRVQCPMYKIMAPKTVEWTFKSLIRQWSMPNAATAIHRITILMTLSREETLKVRRRWRTKAVARIMDRESAIPSSNRWRNQSIWSRNTWGRCPRHGKTLMVIGRKTERT